MIATDVRMKQLPCSVMPRLARSVKKNSSNEYKSIKEESAKKTADQDTDLRNRSTEIISAKNLVNKPNYISNSNSADQHTIDSNSTNHRVPEDQRDIHSNQDTSTGNDVENNTKIQSEPAKTDDLVQKSPAISESSKDELTSPDIKKTASESFEKLKKQSENLHKKSDLYQREDILGGMRSAIPAKNRKTKIFP